MDELAQAAGVSKMTVSRALSGHPLVKDSTRERVQHLAQTHGFRINVAARNLRQRSTRTIGVVIEMTPSHDRSMAEPYPLSLLGGIMQELTSNAYNMVLTTLPLFTAAPPAVDGLILLGQGMHEDAVETVQSAGLPYVIWGSVDGNEDHVTVGSDNVAGGVIAAEHLLAQGRRHCVFVGDATHLEIADRLRGFRDGMAQAGAAIVATADSPFTQEGGYQAARKLLADGCAFDGVFAASDGIAMGVIAALHDQGRTVPDDVAVIGFDDAPGAALFSPPVSSIRQNWDRGGTLLAQKILALTKGGKAVSETLPVEAKPRKS
ncbi:LacI family DNA-binding transcriptional regulator [Novosphingobium sp.]|uniref:LacI family DNA-binding transcriptional regulator n=1 Tax=Novosphingobium sp. TaxID=1874826 RepID=UPI003D12FD30